MASKARGTWNRRWCRAFTIRRSPTIASKFARKTVTQWRGGVRAGNTRDDSPHNRYNIDPKDLVRIQREGRERGEDIVGFYHSHPDHPAHWSSTDLAEAHWFGCSYVITSVAKGKAEATNSFQLEGIEEANKKFVDEQIVRL